MKPSSAGLLLITSMALGACATHPAPAPAPAIVAPAERPQRLEAYDGAIAQAARLEHDGQLRLALWWLKVAETVSANPDDQRAAINRLEARISASLEALLAEGDRALRKHQATAASAAFQKALALDPRSVRARAGLREIESAAMLSAIAHGGGGGPPAPRASGAN